MGLEESISQFSNPLEFAKLCNMLLAAQYGTDFIAVDGLRGDGGNDGYVKSEQRLFAMFCPAKPWTDVDAKYITKIRSDLEKARNLKEAGQYPILRWTFVTPRKLSNEVTVQMLAAAKEHGLDADVLTSTHLAELLYRHRHVAAEFPALQMLDVDRKIDELAKLLRESGKIPPASDESKREAPPIKQTEDYQKAIAICMGPRTVDTKRDLRTLYYKTTDLTARLQCILGLLNWFSMVNDRMEDHLEFCEDGIRIAKQLNAKRELAVILAYKGHRLSDLFGQEDMEGAAQSKFEGLLGISLITDAEKEAKIRRLHQLQDASRAAFSEAQDVAKGLGQYDVIGEVYLHIGSAAGTRYIHFAAYGPKERAEYERSLCKRSLLLAKDIFAAAGDELQVGFALFNLANDLRAWGENSEAIALTKEALELAKKHGHELLRYQCEVLLRTIESGKIPNYMRGERSGFELP